MKARRVNMESIWEKEARRARFDALKENKSNDVSTNVLIIGGGIAGILCAYKLKNEGVDCMLVEAAEICGGITKNTTAKITLQHGLIYDKLIRRFGENKARLYVEAQKKVCKEYARLWVFDYIQECLRQDTRGMRGKARRADQNHESGDCRDEKGN